MLVLSGDGDWGAFLETLGRVAASRADLLLGLESRSYLRRPRTRTKRRRIWATR